MIRRAFRSPRFLLLGFGMAGCAALILARGWYAHDLRFRFLAWNLILAVIPALAAAALRHDAERGHRVRAFAWGAVWLLFLPNAPYLITDLIHLEPRPPVPYWFDIGLFTSFVGAGILAAFSSFQDVQHVVARRFGWAASWSVLSVAAFASGFGIYLGRMQRWNSWDVIMRPADLFHDVTERLLEPWLHRRTLAVTLLYGAVMLFGFVAIRIIMAPRSFETSERQDA